VCMYMSGVYIQYVAGLQINVCVCAFLLADSIVLGFIVTGVHACSVTEQSVSMCVISLHVLLLIIEMTNIGLNLAVNYRNDSVNCGKHGVNLVAACWKIIYGL